jgi:hypothetical protein
VALATILPEVVKVSINSSLVFSVEEAKDDDAPDITWSLVSLTGPAAPSISGKESNKFLVFTPSKIQVLKLSVIYTGVNQTTGLPEVFEADKVFSVSFSGLKIGPISRADASREPSPDGVFDDPVFGQVPLNVHAVNLRAKMTPCFYWKGNIREYVVLEDDEGAIVGIEDPGLSTSVVEDDRTETRDYLSNVGWVVTALDIEDGGFSEDELGKVRPLSRFNLTGDSFGCCKVPAGPWRAPDSSKHFLACNGSKPGENPSKSGDIPACPFYTGSDWKFVTDEQLGFRDSGDNPVVAAEHIQELRIKSENWSRFTNPKAEFNSRFPVDGNIWTWRGYLTEGENGVVVSPDNEQKIQISNVHVDDSVTNIIVEPITLVEPGTQVVGEQLNFPTLIKELGDVGNIRIDFPLGDFNTPFVIRQFNVDEKITIEESEDDDFSISTFTGKDSTEVFGHVVGATKKTVFLVNIDYALVELQKRGYIPAFVPVDETIAGGDSALTHIEYLSFLQENAPDLIYQTTTDEDGNFVFGLTSEDTPEVQAGNRVRLLYAGGQDEIVNRLKVFLPDTVLDNGFVFSDKTVVKLRFLHGWAYQTSFEGDCDNTDSEFFGWNAELSVQLASGFESIDRLIIASPDLAGIYARFNESEIEGGKKEAYFLERKTKTVIIPKEDILPLYGYKGFVIRVSDFEANRLSYWQVTSLDIVSPGLSLGIEDIEVIDHTIDGSGIKQHPGIADNLGVSYSDGAPLPANYLHIKLKNTLCNKNTIGFSLEDQNVSIVLTFIYFVHRQAPSPSGNAYSPLNPTIPIQTTGSLSYSLSILDDDGTGAYSPGRPLPSDMPILKRDYRISGDTISHRIRYVVIFKDDEGRPIGKKQSFILFSVSIPSCGDVEISYAWSPFYTGFTLAPVGLRFCNWKCFSYPGGDVDCTGAPALPGGERNGQALIIRGACFDHGIGLDKVWWPYSRCLPLRYIRPQNSSINFEFVPNQGQSTKYIAGYRFFHESVDNSGFRNCEQGIRHKVFSPRGVSFEDFVGIQAVRSGDLRGGLISTIGAFGTKNGSQWFWGVERERKVFYTGVDKAMNYLNISSGFASIFGTQGVDGGAYLPVPAGVDLNSVATEELVHPFDVFQCSSMANSSSLETYDEGSRSVEVGEASLDIPNRRHARYYLTPVVPGEDPDWKWPVVEWVFKNNPGSSVDKDGIFVPSRRGQFEEGGLKKQVAWVYRDKTTPEPILKTQGILVSSPVSAPLSMRAFRLEYPPDVENLVGPPEVFVNLPSERSLTTTYRPPEEDVTISFEPPQYSFTGLIVQHPRVRLGTKVLLGPPRSILPNGTFISKGSSAPEFPYLSGMKIPNSELIDNFLTIDDVPSVDLDAPLDSSDREAHRGMLVKIPIVYHSMPYRTGVLFGEPRNPAVQDIVALYRYSSAPNGGLDVSKGLLFTSPGTGSLESLSQVSARFDSYPGETVSIKFTTGGAVSDPYTSGFPNKFLKETFIEQIKFVFKVNNNGGFIGDIPTISFFKKDFGDSTFSLVETRQGTVGVSTSGTEVSILFDNIGFTANEIRFRFDSPVSAGSNSVFLVSVQVQGRVFQSSSDFFESKDKKYAPSLMRKEQGIGVNIPSSDLIPIWGLPTADNDGISSTIAQDSYTGDTRRTIFTTTQQIKRPQFPVLFDNTKAFSGQFKSGRVAQDVARGDRELRSANARDTGLCDGTTPLRKETFEGGSRGPLECVQEGMYLFAKRLLGNTAEYSYFMHPQEEEFFLGLGFNQSIFPNRVGVSLQLSVEEPVDLEEFRGDNSDKYIGEPFQALGHGVFQDTSGNCWCYIGVVTPICGVLSAPCIDRYIFHEHSNKVVFTSDLGTVIRRFQSVVARAWTLTFLGASGDLSLPGAGFAFGLVNTAALEGVNTLAFFGQFGPDNVNAQISLLNSFNPSDLAAPPFYWPTTGIG